MEALLVLVALALLVAPIASLLVGLELRTRVRRLEARMAALETERHVGEVPARAPREVAAPPPRREPPPEPELAPSAPEPAPALSPPTAPPQPPPGRPAPAAAPARRPVSWGQLEGLLGERWLNRVGALVLVLGIGFFLKYAFDNAWVGPTGRVVIGLLAGIGFLLVGERLQQAAYRVPAQGLTAAGIATLYLSVYAAYGFYRLVPQAAAFAVMVLVTTTGMAVAIRHEARVIAILANLGGFLTPIVLSTGTDAAVALFTYLAVLDAGMLASAWWRRWTELHVLSFGLTQGLYWGWFDAWYRPEKLPVALVAATVFFLLFALVGPVEAARGRPGDRLDLRAGGTALLILAAPIAYFVAARAILSPDHRRALALLCLALATFYVLLAQWALRAVRDDGRLALLQFTIALAFVTLTFPVQFTEHGVTIAWSVEGAALLWGGFRLGVPKLRGGALVVLALAAVRWLMLVEPGGGHDGLFVVDHRAFLPTAFFAAACALGATLYQRGQRDAAAWEAAARPILLLAAFGSAAFFMTAELGAYRPLGLSRAHLGVLRTSIWIVTAMPLLALARADRTRILFGATTVLLLAVGLTAVVRDAPEWRWVASEARPPVLNLRFVSGLLITALYGLYARMVPAFPVAAEAQRARLGAAAGAATGLFLLWHLSAEILHLPLAGLLPREALKVRQMGLSILWTVYALVAMGIGLRWSQAHVRLGAIGLFALTVAKVFLVDLAGLDAVYRILSFVVLGAVLLLASFLYTRYRGQLGGGAP